ncbi:response regulator transcription factor [Vogesella sp. LIG4]|uniref:response regulator transcription factor n=1 Tax=Vogesella sp. LIG4 TaxID=1192162 RepID=UPI00081FC701|nr:response regulator [Vogesella sp. LIG4]SCK19877.1 two component transcriptional regulator, LuxR family [Vogesella sp. LIG4]
MTRTDIRIHIVDDDEAFRDSLLWLLESHDYRVHCHDSAEGFLAGFQPGQGVGCLILDIRMPGMSGLELYEELQARGNSWPVIFITGHGDVPMAVQAVKRGAHDFLEKPFNQEALLTAVQSALAAAASARQSESWAQQCEARLATLTSREREVLERVIEGKMNKIIADDLGISIKTVEAHRGKMMDKMGARSIADLVQTVVAYRQQKGRQH